MSVCLVTKICKFIVPLQKHPIFRRHFAPLALGAKILIREVWVRPTCACKILSAPIKVCRSYSRKSDFEQIHITLSCIYIYDSVQSSPICLYKHRKDLKCFTGWQSKPTSKFNYTVLREEQEEIWERRPRLTIIWIVRPLWMDLLRTRWQGRCLLYSWYPRVHEYKLVIWQLCVWSATVKTEQQHWLLVGQIYSQCTWDLPALAASPVGKCPLAIFRGHPWVHTDVVFVVYRTAATKSSGACSTRHTSK